LIEKDHHLIILWPKSNTQQKQMQKVQRSEQFQIEEMQNQGDLKTKFSHHSVPEQQAEVE
jgi:hypothetical protein